MLRPPVFSDAYFQVNFVDGFGFLDVRGGLARRFRDEFQEFAETTEANALPALSFRGPTDPEHPIIELKVGIDSVWAHIRPGATRVGIRQECSRVVEAACGMIGVTHFTRQGLRSQHLFGVDSTEEAVAAVRAVATPPEPAWSELGDVASACVVLQFVSGRLKANMQLRPVQSARVRIVTDGPGATSVEPPVGDGPRIGVLLDVDVFDDGRSDTRDAKPHLNRALEYIDGRVLPVVTRLLGHG